MSEQGSDRRETWRDGYRPFNWRRGSELFSESEIVALERELPIIADRVRALIVNAEYAVAPVRDFPAGTGWKRKLIVANYLRKLVRQSTEYRARLRAREAAYETAKRASISRNIIAKQIDDESSRLIGDPVASRRNRKIISRDGAPCPLCGGATEIRAHVAITESMLQGKYYSRWGYCPRRTCPQKQIYDDRFKVGAVAAYFP